MTAPREPDNTILVVDDDPAIRTSLEELLSGAGYSVTSLASGDVALRQLCQMAEPPAVVLVDLLMPGLNAWQLVAEMKRRERLAAVPVLAMTGAAPSWGSPLPERWTLRKPFDPDHLLSTVAAAIAGRGPAGQ